MTDMPSPEGDHLNLRLVWNSFRAFESLTKGRHTFSEFLTEWKEKMALAQAAGCNYSSVLLACKLLEMVNLKFADSFVILGSIENATALDVLDVMIERLEAFYVNDIEDFSSTVIVKCMDDQSEIKTESSERVSDANLSEVIATTDPNFSHIEIDRSQAGDAADLICPKCRANALDTIIIDDAVSRKTKGKLSCRSCDFELPLLNVFETKSPTKYESADADKAALQIIDASVKDEPLDNNQYAFLDISVHELKDDDEFEPIEKVAASTETIVAKRKSGDKLHICSQCGKTFNRPVLLKAHAKQAHGITIVKMPTKKELAERRLADAGADKPIKRRQKNSGPFQCEHCGHKFSRKTHLKNHEAKIHKLGPDGIPGTVPKKRGPTTCKYCGKVFERYWNYQSHLPVHTGEKKFKCDECDLSFSHASALAYHKIKHTGERPFKCDQCTKAFFNSSNLVLHMRREHLEERPFQCDHCTLGFVSKAHLKRHVLVHTGERPYKCDFCEKAYRDHKSRKKHMQLHAHEANIETQTSLVFVSNLP